VSRIGERSSAGLANDGPALMRRRVACRISSPRRCRTSARSPCRFVSCRAATIAALPRSSSARRPSRSRTRWPKSWPTPPAPSSRRSSSAYRRSACHSPPMSRGVSAMRGWSHSGHRGNSGTKRPCPSRCDRSPAPARASGSISIRACCRCCGAGGLWSSTTSSAPALPWLRCCDCWPAQGCVRRQRSSRCCRASAGGRPWHNPFPDLPVHGAIATPLLVRGGNGFWRAE